MTLANARLVVLVAALGAGCGAPPARVAARAVADDRVPFGPDEREEELAFLRDALRDSYAHLEVKRRDFGVDLDGLFERHRPAARAADTWARYERAMVAFVSELHDGHLVWRRRRGRGESRLRIVRMGLDTRFLDEDLVVSGVWPGSAAEAAGLAVGDRIVAIDGQSVEQRFTRHASLRSWAKLEAARYDFAEEWPASRIGADAAPPVRRLRRETLAGATGELAVAAEARPRPGPPPPPLVVEAEGAAIVLRARSLDVPREAAARQMDEVARRVRAGARGLVVDLRGNGGGTEHIAVAVASAVSPRVVVGGSRRVRLSPAARAARPEWLSLAEDPARPGWSRELPLATAGAGVDPGPMAVLIDAGCRSSCEQLALLLRAAGARVLGETTGGSSGAPIEVRMPRSGAWVEIPAWALADAAGEPIEGHGVVPDEALAPTRADLAAGRDPAMARALAWVAAR